LGVPPPTASWGSMLNDGRAHLFDAPHLVLFPAMAVMLAVLSFNFIGDALRDFLDPRSRIEVGLRNETSSPPSLSNCLYLVMRSQARSFALPRACRVEGSLP